MFITTLLKIMIIKRKLTILGCCLLLAACGAGGSGGGVTGIAPTGSAQGVTGAQGPIGFGTMNSAPVFVGTPKIIGVAVVGSTLSLTGTATMDADFDAVAISYQWQANGVAIPAAKGAVFTITPAQAHLTITAKLTINDGQGAANSIAMATTPSMAVANSAPVFTGTPTISGAAVVGSTLSLAGTATSDADGDIVAISYQWQAGGTAIPGANGVAFTVTAAQAGPSITAKLTINDGQGASNSIVTVTTAPATITTNKITQFGITWTFAKSYTYGKTYGQFANGDYWMVGPVTIIDIFPHSIIDTTGRTLNGSMINPSPRSVSVQGYDSAMYATYGSAFNPALNVARPNQQDMAPVNPLLVPVNSSLVSSISLPTAGALPQLKTAAILTVLASPPPSGSFRPSYSGVNKTIKFNKSQLNYSLLGHLAPVANTPAMATVERYFERPWIDHVPGWLARFSHPSDNMPNYGRGIAARVGVGALMLNLNFSNKVKEKLLISFVQLGLDLYGVAQDGGNNNWHPDGGHASGRKWPIIFAGLVLNDPAMKNIGPGDGTTGTVQFGEDGQTFYVTQTDINLLHTPDLRPGPAVQYVQADLNLPEWGIVHSLIPKGDNRAWYAEYRRCCTANAWSGYVLSARIMHAQALWGHPALFDYQDRYMAVQQAAWLRSWDPWTALMWDTYRASFP